MSVASLCSGRCCRAFGGLGSVAEAIVGAGGVASRDVSVVRNGSRGMFWLEPLVEVETPAGRVAYGPVIAESVPGLFDAGFLERQAASALSRPDRRNSLS